MRKIGQNALSDLFTSWPRTRWAATRSTASGIGHERTYDTKPYEFGDPFNLAHRAHRPQRRAAQRAAARPCGCRPRTSRSSGPSTLTQSSTVLMLDLSLSMPMRDNFLAAKKVAMALHSLISSQFPRDFLGIVGFSEVARELKPEQLPEVSWDFVYGTNMQHAFLLSRRMLARQSGTKQIIMITDGEPTAHIEPGGEAVLQLPAGAGDDRARRCARWPAAPGRTSASTPSCSTPTATCRSFVEKLTQLNQGRAFFTTPETLGDYVLVDFIEQKRAMPRRPPRPSDPRRAVSARSWHVDARSRHRTVHVSHVQ